jgi:hypothetical protein
LGPNLRIIGSLHLYIFDIEISVSENKVAYGLMNYIKGYHIIVCLFSNSPIERIFDGYTGIVGF